MSRYHPDGNGAAHALHEADDAIDVMTVVTFDAPDATGTLEGAHLFFATSAAKKPQDLRRVLELCLDDPAGDLEWFDHYPSEDFRLRPAVPEELSTLELPPDTVVLVERTEDIPVRQYHGHWGSAR